MKKRPLKYVTQPPKSKIPGARVETLFGLFVGSMLGYGLAKDKIKLTDAIALGAIVVKPEKTAEVLKALDEFDKRQAPASDATDTSTERSS